MAPLVLLFGLMTCTVVFMFQSATGDILSQGGTYRYLYIYAVSNVYSYCEITAQIGVSKGTPFEQEKHKKKGAVSS